jgi:hypothetical protein
MSQQDKGKQSKLIQSYKNITIIQNRIIIKCLKISQTKHQEKKKKINPPQQG